MKYSIEESRDWYNSLPAKRSAAAMIVRRGNTVLMVKDDYKDAMTFPGGVIDPEESPLVAAVRETQEETKLSIIVDEAHFFTVAYVAPVNGFMDRYQFFFETIVADETPVASDEVAGIEYQQWVPVSEIGQKAGGRPTYLAIQHMLESGIVIPYIEAPKKGVAPWQT